MTILRDGTKLPGLFLTFEGMDGTGKSSQARMVHRYLEVLGADVVLTREPGGSPGAEEIRALILTGNADRWSRETEILLFAAARRDHVEKIIIPALAAGKTVICDRFADSTRAYQGADHWENVGIYDQIHDLMIPVDPDVTLILDMDPKKCLNRGLNRLASEALENPGEASEDRMESFGLSFQEALNANFERIALMYPERCSMIDADGTMPEVMIRILKEMSRRGIMDRFTPQDASVVTESLQQFRRRSILGEDQADCLLEVHSILRDMDANMTKLHELPSASNDVEISSPAQ